MLPVLRRFAALLALLTVPLSAPATALPCFPAAGVEHDGAAHPHAAPDASHPGGGGHHAPEPSSPAPACPMGVAVGAGSCLGSFVAAEAHLPAPVPDGAPAFRAPAGVRDLLLQASLFRPPRA